MPSPDSYLDDDWRKTPTRIACTPPIFHCARVRLPLRRGLPAPYRRGGRLCACRLSGALAMRATLKKWGIVFWEWLITGVAFGLGVLLVAALFLGICASFADAAQAQTVTIPRAAYQHRDTLIRASRAVWGLDAPVSIFAAQIHTESWWKNSTVSSAGAQGLAQFMPSTAKWLPTVAPEVGAPGAVQSRLGAPGVRHL